jgi:iron(III) transport system permease protein
VLTLFTYPYVLLTVRAACATSTRPRGGQPHARARPLEHVRRAVLPQLRPSIAAGALLVALYTLSDFGAVSLLRFDSFTRVILRAVPGLARHVGAGGYGLMLMVLTIAVLTVEQRTRARAEYHRCTAAAPARHRPSGWAAGGGRPSPPAAPSCSWRSCCRWGSSSTGSSGACRPANPAAHHRAGPTACGPRRSARCSPCSPPGRWPMLSVRRPGRLSPPRRAGLSWSGYALPGVVVALSLVFFGARSPAALPDAVHADLRLRRAVPAPGGRGAALVAAAGHPVARGGVPPARRRTAHHLPPGGAAPHPLRARPGARWCSSPA